MIYAAIMLLGQGLHQWCGCDHDDHAEPVQAGAHASVDGSAAGDCQCVAVSARGHAAHDADTCPICQFHHQGQFSQPALAVVSAQFLQSATPVYRSSPLFARVLRVHAPRAPPADSLA